MLPRMHRNRTAVAGSLTLLLLLGAALPASALLLDARRVAMGGVSPPQPGRQALENPAYELVPAREWSWDGSFPIPLGLLTLFDHPEELDPNNDAFDPVRLANLVLNPPLHLELREPTPLEGDIILDLGQEHLRVYWEDAHLFLPEEPLNFGGRLDRFSLGYGRPLGKTGRWRLSTAPYLDGNLVTELDDAFYGLLAEGDSLLPNSSYQLGGELQAAAGLSFKLLLARSYGDEKGTRIFLAAAPKLIGGLAMIEADMELTGSSGDSLFASTGLDVEQVSYTRVNESAGAGFALDLGIVLRHGPWDLGLGARDLAGSIAFSETRLERQQLEASGGEGESSEVVTELLASGEAHSYRIKPFWTINSAYTGGSFIVLAELRLRPWQETLHLGGEYGLGAWKLRGGLRRDARKSWQYSGGVGRKLGGLQVDLGLETHHRYIQDERGLALALSISL
jgi:hypothetical protein